MPGGTSYAGVMSDDDRQTAGAAAPASVSAPAPASQEYAECVLCRRPTEYPESHRGVTLCPVCTWQEAQRTACSG